jgi:hypothetical protein
MSLALVDCPTGLAGNMLLAALFDLGLPQDAVDVPLAALGLAGAYAIDLEERRSAGLPGPAPGRARTGSRAAPPPLGGAGGHHRRRRPGARLKAQVLSVFGLLAEAEAQVHGQSAERVHFHEVGAIDALVDVVGVCAGLAHFGITPIDLLEPSGRPWHGADGPWAPARAGSRGVGTGPAPGDSPGQQRRFSGWRAHHPTGLALMAVLAGRFGPAPALVPQAVGIGLGSRQLDRPNLLRLVLSGEAPVAPIPIPRRPSCRAGAVHRLVWDGWRNRDGPERSSAGAAGPDR